ncbi:ParB/RepB/Spo0J family partition protein [Bosea sp. (in: a-proteobacteria)]|uniref:ParB/RepB/Spo0J family partition protein n=1 Tax=Bosea sp. (in: a-proteobacteria) TaxID=1871050 RepID=UPI0027350B8E|nr:ParB/RepB/Spo0J family partition protein [Bosea sp. (in: a-proteobacteria)]MDP3407270.1 ParB N-terminal domain-containing protein [Bosea sp. (in: a-proteobacteria)]
MSQHPNEYQPEHLIPGTAVNCRPGDEDVSDLVASIAAHGLLQPLVGRLIADECVEIIDGNRRLKAIHQLTAEGRWQGFVPVMLRGDEPDADAFEISLAANVLRKPLHPVAEYEAFVQLAERGKTNEEIAAHFGISLRQVEQRQALGRLHEDVRRAWLEGRINGDSARAFTLVAPAEQAAYLAKATLAWELRWDNIRRAFTRESVPGTAPMAIFVGEEAYVAAGGELVADLFVEKRDFADAGLLHRLAGDKLKAEAERLAAKEGWAEGLTEQEADGHHGWDRLPKPALRDEDKPERIREIEARLAQIHARQLEIEPTLEEAWSNCEDEDDLPIAARALQEENDRLDRELVQLEHERDDFDEGAAAWLSLPAEQRAKAVVIVRINREGGLDVIRGHLNNKRPPAPPKATAMQAPKPQPATAGETAEASEPVRLSANLLDELAQTATMAAAEVLATEPRIAMAAFVASAVAYGAPVRININGRHAGPDLPWPLRSWESQKLSFGAAFRTALAWDEETLSRHVATAIAHALDFTSKANNANSMEALSPVAVSDLRFALPLEAHRAALVECFDAAAYFTAAPKTEALAAIADCGDEPAKHAKLKKGDLVAVATRLATAHRWLPPLLRGEIFAAIETPAEPETASADLAASEAHQSAADAALAIWRDEDGRIDEGDDPAGFDAAAWFGAQKAPAIRAALKEMEQPAPVGWTKAQLVDLAVKTAAEKGWRPADLAEAA